MFTTTLRHYLPATDHEGRQVLKVQKQVRLFGLLIWQKEVILPHGFEPDNGTFFTSI
jgi:hypothetical protein